MVYQRLLREKPKSDPLVTFTKPAPESSREKTFEPPASARTFADHDAAFARRLCAARPHVIIREDPMFGRRGYAREVLADPAAPGGYLVLVIAFTTRKDSYGNWVEPIKPRADDRRFWAPGKVEFVPR